LSNDLSRQPKYNIFELKIHGMIRTENMYIYMWFTGINYYKPAVEKDRDSIVPEQSGKVEYVRERLLGIAMKIH
jgi:hypothetical protein